MDDTNDVVSREVIPIPVLLYGKSSEGGTAMIRLNRAGYEVGK